MQEHSLALKAMYAVIGALASLIPYAFREESISSKKAGAAVVAGFLVAGTFTHPLALWLDHYLPGSDLDIEPAIAVTLGLISIQVIQTVMVWWAKRGEQIVDKVAGTDKEKGNDS